MLCVLKFYSVTCGWCTHLCLKCVYTAIYSTFAVLMYMYIGCPWMNTVIFIPGPKLLHLYAGTPDYMCMHACCTFLLKRCAWTHYRCISVRVQLSLPCTDDVWTVCGNVLHILLLHLFGHCRQWTMWSSIYRSWEFLNSQMAVGTHMYSVQYISITVLALHLWVYCRWWPLHVFLLFLGVCEYMTNWPSVKCTVVCNLFCYARPMCTF